MTGLARFLNEGAADFLDARRPGGGNMSVAVSSFAPPRANVGVVKGGCFITLAPRETSSASLVSLTLSA